MSEKIPEPLNGKQGLLDRQILDKDDMMVAKVDDVELEQRADGSIVVTGFLTGPGALGPRLGGFLGAVSVAAWSRLANRAEDDPARVDYRDVAKIGTAVHLAVGHGDVDVAGLEDWTRERIISAFPAAGRNP